MLESSKRQEDMDPKQAKAEIKTLQKRLMKLQQDMKQKGIPVVFVLDGLASAGKGSIISKVTTRLEPRSYWIYSSTKPEEGEARRPFLWRYWRDLPAKGDLAIFERGWYRDAFESLERSEGRGKERIDSVRKFERQLYEDGYLIIKVFLHIGKEMQRKRMEAMEDERASAWRIRQEDWDENRYYDEECRVREELMRKTDETWAPWHVIWNEDKNSGVCRVLRLLCDQMEAALEKGPAPIEGRKESKKKLLTMPPLAEVKLDKFLTEEDYDRELKREREKLQRLHGLLYREKIPVIIGFEGWDASGKGGAIRRLSWALDPRGFQVVPIAAPSPDALARHYLWRFWQQIPKDGHMAIFDRTWYGRVMVERVEGFTPPERWQMAYEEIREFEKELYNWGAVVLKFWIHIDQDTQLARFTERQNTPEKLYKITEEDWRNREKWPQYEEAVDEMLKKTSTKYAPWIVVEGNDKPYARAKVLRTVRKALEDRLVR